MNAGIIVAAGSGQRFAGDRPKQFVQLHGKPLILHTLEKFEACVEIDEIVLVLSEQGRKYFAEIEDQFEVPRLESVVIGGKTRAESVKNGLDAVDSSAAGIVAIHDGARPLVAVEDISRTVKIAGKIGAACLVAEVADTIKEVEDDRIVRTLDRSQLRRALTPQAFRYDILKSAFEGADLSNSVTDECYLVEKLGIEIALVEGDSRNIKVTRAEDLIFAEALLAQL